jgi:hypothetical protein
MHADNGTFSKVRQLRDRERGRGTIYIAHPNPFIAQDLREILAGTGLSKVATVPSLAEVPTDEVRLVVALERADRLTAIPQFRHWTAFNVPILLIDGLRTRVPSLPNIAFLDQPFCTDDVVAALRRLLFL